MFDRYSFDEQRVGFYFNSDPQCKKLRDLDPVKDYIVIYNGENSVPSIHIVEDEDSVDVAHL